ncbi:MAG TPA: hypothetical protein VJ752_13040 [Burkholderiaceae bacterium]|nr:hypothetical protein [Burkholderiaceae bacterium]
MNRLIDAVNTIRAVAPSELGGAVRQVAVILTSPRSGSSLLTSVLARHPGIATLDGEIEPYLALTGNGFGFSSNSDAIGDLANPAALADCVLDDLTVAGDGPPDLDLIKRRWRNRLLLQFPAVFAQPSELRRLAQSLDEAVTASAARRCGGERAWQEYVLGKVFRHDGWRMAYYDGMARAGAAGGFDVPLKLEEPPFVMPRHQRRRFAAGDAASKVLLFKTPPDVYRLGLYRQLFPHADIKYIHLTRGYAQAVNGLIDGWQSPVGFFSHDLRWAGVDLRIGGYTDVLPFGRRWWKFDMPPNWREFTAAPLEQVCLNQWLSPHRAVLQADVPALRLRFEDFLADPVAAMGRITGYLGLAPMAMQAQLPVTMATEQPARQRWRKREQALLALGRQPEVAAMMAALGYDMDPEGWS